MTNNSMHNGQMKTTHNDDDEFLVLVFRSNNTYKYNIVCIFAVCVFIACCIIYGACFVCVSANECMHVYVCASFYKHYSQCAALFSCAVHRAHVCMCNVYVYECEATRHLHYFSVALFLSLAPFVLYFLLLLFHFH